MIYATASATRSARLSGRGPTNFEGLMLAPTRRGRRRALRRLARHRARGRPTRTPAPRAAPAARDASRTTTGGPGRPGAASCSARSARTASGSPTRTPSASFATCSEADLLAAATDEAYLEQIDLVAADLARDLARPAQSTVGDDGPVAFLCAEFGVHRSLPVYSGGLGVLAGDLLKEASDQALPFVGAGLLYRRGYFHQRMDLSGWQQEYWIESDPNVLPAVRVTGPDGAPLTVSVPIWDGELAAHVWRCEVGRVPLYLLDAEIGENTPLQRWVTARLYEGNRSIRLAQYALLGVGAVRALEAMGITPSLYHLNEGHAALATLAVAASHGARPEARRTAATPSSARGAHVRLHDPHAGPRRQRDLQPRRGAQRARSPVLGAQLRPARGPRARPHAPQRRRREHRAHAARDPRLALDQRGQPAPRRDRAGDVARDVPARQHRRRADQLRHQRRAPADLDGAADARAAHRVLRRGLGAPRERPRVMWKRVDDLDDERLWSVRCEQRDDLVQLVRRKVVVDRLARGEDIDFVQSGREAFDPTYLTVGFARRLATYKRLNLLSTTPSAPSRCSTTTARSSSCSRARRTRSTTPPRPSPSGCSTSSACPRSATRSSSWRTTT